MVSDFFQNGRFQNGKYPRTEKRIADPSLRVNYYLRMIRKENERDAIQFAYEDAQFYTTYKMRWLRSKSLTRELIKFYENSKKEWGVYKDGKYYQPKRREDTSDRKIRWYFRERNN